MLSRSYRLLLLMPLMLVVIVFLIVPMVLGLSLSLTNYAPLRPHLTIQFVGLHNYNRVLSNDIFQEAVVHGLVFTLATVVMELILGAAIAWALRQDFRGRVIVRVRLVDFSWLVSPIASGVIWHYLLTARTGLVYLIPAYLGQTNFVSPLSTPLAFLVIIGAEIWRQSPLVAFLLLPGLLAIPHEQWDNARLDGLSVYLQIRHVVLPYLRMLLLTITLLLIGSAFDTGESILLLTRGGTGTQTMLPGLYIYNKAIVASNWTLGATSGWLIALGMLIVSLVYLFLTRRPETI